MSHGKSQCPFNNLYFFQEMDRGLGMESVELRNYRLVR